MEFGLDGGLNDERLDGLAARNLPASALAHPVLVRAHQQSCLLTEFLSRPGGCTVRASAQLEIEVEGLGKTCAKILKRTTGMSTPGGVEHSNAFASHAVDGASGRPTAIALVKLRTVVVHTCDLEHMLDL